MARFSQRLFPRTRSLWYGALLPFQSLQMIFSYPSLLFWSALPIALTLTVYFFLIRRMQSEVKEILHRYLNSWGWNPDGFLTSTLFVFTGILMVIVGALTFSFISSIVSSPFNDILAERAERWTEPPLSPVAKIPLLAKMKLVMIDLMKSVAAVIGVLSAILLSWVPGLNLVALCAAFQLVAFQYISYPQTRRGEGFSEGMHFLWRHFFACLGFGAVLSSLFAIPVLSSLAVPIAVVGGTMLYARAKDSAGAPLK